jgi:uncharacterized protein YbjQ (UPF0145 family)
MKSFWIVLGIISFIMIGCGSPIRVQETYIRVDQQKVGPVDVFNSFDDVGVSYKKVAELKITDHRPPTKENRDDMIESLKTKARKIGADCIVIVEEGKTVERIPMPAGDGMMDMYTIFIECTAIVYG